MCESSDFVLSCGPRSLHIAEFTSRMGFLTSHGIVTRHRLLCIGMIDGRGTRHVLAAPAYIGRYSGPKQSTSAIVDVTRRAACAVPHASNQLECISGEIVFRQPPMPTSCIEPCLFTRSSRYVFGSTDTVPLLTQPIPSRPLPFSLLH